MRRLLVLAAGAALSGCLTMNPRVEVAEPTNALPAPPPVVAQNGGAIFQPASYRPLFEDYRARHRGDALNVQIVEKIVASQKSNSSVDKTGSVDAKVSALPYIKPGALTRASVEGSSNNSFSGQGTTESSNNFFGSISAVVVDVLPNGSGQVDPLQIQAGNTIESTKIANVRIEHRGRGAQADAQQIGWLGRFFLNLLPI